MARETVGIGMLGTGFIGQFHHQGLRHVAGARPAACFGRDTARREAFATRNGYARAYDSIEAVCAAERRRVTSGSSTPAMTRKRASVRPMAKSTSP